MPLVEIAFARRGLRAAELTMVVFPVVSVFAVSPLKQYHPVKVLLLSL
jgi:hypothetical protein